MKENTSHPLQTHYDKLYEQARELLFTHTYTLDARISDPTDRRMGLTLLLRPSGQVKARMQAFLDELKAVEPQQYYYPSTDIHVTVLSIISCYQDFDLQTIPLPAYLELVEKSILAQPDFKISFRGITASPAGVMVQGFLEGAVLQKIREALRQNFNASGLEQSIDTRYTLQTAHCTVVRFREPLARHQAFVEVLDRYRNHDFGTCRVEVLELVHNDWYQRTQYVKKLGQFNLS